jgi:hypothetical protein
LCFLETFDQAFELDVVVELANGQSVSVSVHLMKLMASTVIGQFVNIDYVQHVLNIKVQVLQMTQKQVLHSKKDYGMVLL